MAIYYVSTTGNDTTGDGSIGNPWATLSKFHTAAAAAGDVCYMRGGTYTLAGPSGYINLTKSGTAGNVIRVENYPGEVPVIDGINLSGAGDPCVVISNGSYWYLKGITMTRAYGCGIIIQGANPTNNTLELCITHNNERVQNSGAAMAISTGSNNLFLNCDSYRNGQDSATNGGSGFGCNSQGTGNVMRGCRAWRNNDNGIELFDGANVLVENCWVWQTGYNDSLVRTAGDGVGYKLGGAAAGDGGHTIRRNLSWRNAQNGFDENAADNPITLYNNTSWEDNFGGGPHAGYAFSGGVAHVLRNNLAVDPDTVNFHANVIHTYNSWNTPPGISVSAADFQSTDFSGASGARQADGSLPVLSFLRLAAGSSCIDAGTDVGIAYSGAAPDLGAYEYTAALIDNLKVFYEFQANGNDSHGSRHLTNNNAATFVTGKVGNAADLVRASQQWFSYADHTDFEPGDGNFTITAWAKATTGYGINPMVWSKFSTGQESYRLYLDPPGESAWFTLSPNANGVGAISVGANAVIANTWVFVVCHYDAAANLMTLILNNGTPATASQTGGAANSTADFMIGNSAANTDAESRFNGQIDQVGYWTRKLTATEITWLYNSGNGRTYAEMTSDIERRRNWRPLNILFQ